MNVLRIVFIVFLGFILAPFCALFAVIWCFLFPEPKEQPYRQRYLRDMNRDSDWL